MKIWLDDKRRAPKGYIRLRSYIACKIFLTLFKWMVTAISFDHDLGTKKTGYDIAVMIEKMAYHKKIHRIAWEVHSANPVGRDRIISAMKSAERYWEETN